MTRKLRLALAQFDFPVGAVASNTQRIKAMVAEARDVHGADLVLFPELALSGYPPEDLLMRPSFLSACEQAMQEIAASCRGITAVVGWPQSAGSVVYNAASVLRDGRIDLTYRKRELPNYAVFDERRHFAVDPDGGACCFELKGVKVGLVVCEDLWFAEPMAPTAALGAELVPMGSAGVKTMAVVTGEVDAYVHAGGQYEWDSAAPVAVARAYGLHTSRVDGTDLRYNCPDPTLPDLVVCRPELRHTLMRAIGATENVEETP